MTVFGIVADALPATAGQYPVPKGLRRRVMRAVRAEPRDAAGGAGPARPRAGRWLLPRPVLAGGLAVFAALAVTLGVVLGSGGSGGTHVFAASVGNASVRVSGSHADLIVRKLPHRRRDTSTRCGC